MDTSSSSSASSSSFSGGDSRVLEWELGLPSAAYLTPLSQFLIPPSLVSAFSISPLISLHLGDLRATTDLLDLAAGDDDGAAARSSKRPRLVWTAQLHRRFVEVVARLGVKSAVPKAIVQMMNVEGLTSENVASHLQKYRSYVKRFAANSDPSARNPVSPPVMMAPGFYSYGTYGAYHENLIARCFLF